MGVGGAAVVFRRGREFGVWAMGPVVRNNLPRCYVILSRFPGGGFLGVTLSASAYMSEEMPGPNE